MTAPTPSTIRGIGWILIVCIGITVLNVALRYARETLPAMQILCIACLGGFILGLPIWLKQIDILRNSPHKKHHLKRAILEIIGFSCIFWSVLHMPLSSFMSINYARPIVAGLLAVWVLKEHTNPLLWLSSVLGVIGVLIITNPTEPVYLIPALVTFFGACCFATASIVVKELTNVENVHNVTGYMLLFTGLLALPFALYQWQPITGNLLSLSVVAGSFFIVQYGVSKAFYHAPVVVLMPIQFITVILAAISGAIFFDEIIDNYTILGGAIIFAAVLCLLQSQKKAPS